MIQIFFKNHTFLICIRGYACVGAQQEEHSVSVAKTSCNVWFLFWIVCFLFVAISWILVPIECAGDAYTVKIEFACKKADCRMDFMIALRGSVQQVSINITIFSQSLPHYEQSSPLPVAPVSVIRIKCEYKRIPTRLFVISLIKTVCRI